MNPKQKKLIWIVGIAVAVFYFAPSFINSYRRAAFIRQQNEALMAKMQAAKSARPLPAPGAAPAGTAPGTAATPSAYPQYDNLAGIWQGQALLPDYGNCNLKLELRPATQPGQFTGFPVLVCFSPPLLGPKALAQLNPSSAVLTGKPNDKSVEFTVDKIIGKGGERQCSFISFAVTRFGNDQIAAEWKEDACPAGQMLLKRIGR